MPAGTVAGSAMSVAIIGSWLIIASPASENVTSTVSPEMLGTERPEPTVPFTVGLVEPINRAMRAVDPAARTTTPRSLRRSWRDRSPWSCGQTASPEKVSSPGVLVSFDLASGKTFIEDAKGV